MYASKTAGVACKQTGLPTPFHSRNYGKNACKRKEMCGHIQSFNSSRNNIFFGWNNFGWQLHRCFNLQDLQVKSP